MVGSSEERSPESLSRPCPEHDRRCRPPARGAPGAASRPQGARRREPASDRPPPRVRRSNRRRARRPGRVEPAARVVAHRAPQGRRPRHDPPDRSRDVLPADPRSLRDVRRASGGRARPPGHGKRRRAAASGARGVVSGSVVSPELRARVRGIAVPIALAFGRLGLTPNALTVIGFGIAVAAGAAAASEAWGVAGLLVIFGGVFDLFDGALARATNRVTRVGGFLDSVFDRAGESVLYVGIAIGSVSDGRVAPMFALGAILAAAAMGSSFMVSYTRA